MFFHRFDLIPALIHKGGCAEQMVVADQVLFALAAKIDEMGTCAHGQLHARGIRLMEEIRLMTERAFLALDVIEENLDFLQCE